MKTSVLKDGHIFVVHIVDPKEPSEEDEADETKQDGEDKESVTEKADQEKSEKEDKTTDEGIVNDIIFNLNGWTFIIVAMIGEGVSCSFYIHDMIKVK